MNTCNLKQHLDDIINGNDQQLAPMVHIPVATMVVGQQYKFTLPFDCSFLAMIQWYLDPNNNLIETSPDLLLGVRINLEQGPMLPWGRQNNLAGAFLGPVRVFYVTVLQLGVLHPAADAIFLAGKAMGFLTSTGYVFDGR